MHALALLPVSISTRHLKCLTSPIPKIVQDMIEGQFFLNGSREPDHARGSLSFEG